MLSKEEVVLENRKIDALLHIDASIRTAALALMGIKDILERMEKPQKKAPAKRAKKDK